MIDFGSLAVTRAAQDKVLERVRLTVDGQEYILPVLKSGPNARWLERMDEDFRQLLVALQGQDASAETLVAALTSREMMPRVKAALAAYDATGVLPSVEELDERLTDMAWVKLLLEVWAAANPLVGIGLEWIAAILSYGSSLRGSSRPQSTAGRRRKSGTA